jgi:hypothetical protein
MIGLIVGGAIAVFVAVVWFLDRRRGADPTNTRWDDPGQAAAHAAATLSKLGKVGPGRP